ncbi:hypothetical protein BDA99DRAFT_492219 [Phascolomyces articulosus]|uniref:Uncharacterized protein n=1 Tax=Phascolomyces articulosus TaxID=60185 RepID=A0AAD5PJT1_9FUNG|nr:hypothetical protein BDA99DRAFT_492219 [Phascolomyces articulosus]
MVRSESAPLDMTIMSDVRRVLHSQQQVFSLLDRSKEYHLCYALAALLCNVYRVLELTTSDDDTSSTTSSHATLSNDDNNVYQRLREKVSAFRARDMIATPSTTFPSSFLPSSVSTPSTNADELTELWQEMDQLMDAVYCLGYEKCYAPPAYHTRDEEEEDDINDELPPPYVSEKTQNDLDNLLSAIDRLSQVAPQLNNQRVDMTERQANELTAASIGKIVERLALGRMNDQRATLPTILNTSASTHTKHNKDIMLRHLIVQICHTTSKSLDHQRVSLDSKPQKKINVASMHGLFDRLDRGRMADQEWKSPPDERLFREMSGMMDTVVKSLHRPRFSKQRFQMTATKERNMFISDLLHKVDKLEGRRMENQDASIRQRHRHPSTTYTSSSSSSSSSIPSPPLTPRNIEEDEEIFDLFDHMAKSQFSNQRAVYRGPVTTTSQCAPLA